MAKGKSKPSTSSAGKKISTNISPPMAAGSPTAPGPINDPADHPSNNLPSPTDPRWGEEMQAMASGQGGM